MTRKAALEAALTEARAAEPMMTGNPFAWARKRTSEPVNPTMTRDELVAAAESIGMRLVMTDDLWKPLWNQMMWYPENKQTPGPGVIKEWAYQLRRVVAAAQEQRHD